MDDALLSSRNLRSYILIWVHWPVKLMGEFSHSLTMGWEMLQYTLRVVDHIQVNSPDDDDDDVRDTKLYHGWSTLSHDSLCRKRALQILG